VVLYNMAVAGVRVVEFGTYRVVELSTTTVRAKKFSYVICKYLLCLCLAYVTITHLTVVSVCINN